MITSQKQLAGWGFHAVHYRENSKKGRLSRVKFAAPLASWIWVICEVYFKVMVEGAYPTGVLQEFFAQFDADLFD